ncbi:hypothetical protein MJ1_0398 [Nanobdella aerobiophila]|uniref:HEPN domain-containing protein n=1 Tax=Nanobdella aerobiophila TaxID=2586965 RepID=A0A915SSR2_9ARCH|nr:HEPN domain-containing protein [Nanobdella aerobiophila]BBL45561.1 hypothetical protein MJ1_0398 [Nanobdella aerobiophila]
MVGIFDMAKLLTGSQSLMKKIPEENKEYSKELIDNAKKNLEESKDLYNKRNYALSIYYLDQALLLSIKSMSLLFSLLKLKDVKEKEYKSFEEFINKNKMIDKMKKLISQNSRMYELMLNDDNKKRFKDDFEKYKNNLEDFIKKLKNINDRKSLVRLSSEDIKKLFSLNDNINKYQLSDEILESYINMAMNMLNKMGGAKFNNTLNQGMFKSLVKREIEKNVNNLNIFGNLLVLTIVLMLHERSSKEYDRDLDFSPNNYTEDLGVVKEYNNLRSMVDNTIKFLENFLQVLDNGTGFNF